MPNPPRSIDARFSRRGFHDAGLEGMPALLGELSDQLTRRVSRLGDESTDRQERVTLFLAACDEIVSELNQLGHGLHRLHLDSDQRLEHNQQCWGTDYWDRRPRGLDLELRPFRARALWLIGAAGAEADRGRESQP